MRLITPWPEWIPSMSVLILWPHLLLDFSFLLSSLVEILAQETICPHSCVSELKSRYREWPLWLCETQGVVQECCTFTIKKRTEHKTGFKVQLFPFLRICQTCWLLWKNNSKVNIKIQKEPWLSGYLCGCGNRAKDLHVIFRGIASWKKQKISHIFLLFMEWVFGKANSVRIKGGSCHLLVRIQKKKSESSPSNSPIHSNFSEEQIL